MRYNDLTNETILDGSSDLSDHLSAMANHAFIQFSRLDSTKLPKYKIDNFDVYEFSLTSSIHYVFTNNRERVAWCSTRERDHNTVEFNGIFVKSDHTGNSLTIKFVDFLFRIKHYKQIILSDRHSFGTKRNLEKLLSSNSYNIVWTNGTSETSVTLQNMSQYYTTNGEFNGYLVLITEK